MKLHVVVISWTGKSDNARTIAAAVGGHADDATVVYSNADERDETGPGQWIRLPDSDFYGRKFAAAAQAAGDAALLLIHADTSFADWPGLVGRCRAAFARHADLGFWSPDFTNTPYRFNYVEMLPLPDGDGLVSVAQNDGIVFALSPAVVGRLRQLDFSQNNLGWGIDWAALAFCHANGLLVVRDPTLVVTHPKGSGYGTDAAAAQMRAFLGQLTFAERNQLLLLRTYYLTHRREAKSRVFRFLMRHVWRRKEGPYWLLR